MGFPPKTFLLLLALLWMAAPAHAQEAAPKSRAEIALSFAPVVKKVSPAVVNIYTRATVRRVRSPFMDDPLFRHFFGDAFPGGLTRERAQHSLGSGVIVSADGEVVTNNHLVEGSQKVTVALADRREFEAEVVSADPRTDIAILRMNAPGVRFPKLDLADSDAVAVGDLCLAVGNPFGVGQTVSLGIVSAVARAAAVHAGDVNYFIQTDAAINPGNSGGALVSAGGKLIGVPSAIYSRDGGSIGIGFAIPSNLVRAVLASVGKEGRVVRGWTGIAAQTLTSGLARSIGMSRPGGVIVKKLHPASPAKEAGLRPGDVILAVNDHSIDDREAFLFRQATASVGTEMNLRIWRENGEDEIYFRLIAAPENPPRRERLLQGRQPLAGVHVANLSPALAQELGLEDDSSGVIVLKVDRPSPAAALGVRRGDLVLEVNGKRVTSVARLEGLIAPSARGWRITLARRGAAITVVVGP